MDFRDFCRMKHGVLFAGLLLLLCSGCSASRTTQNFLPPQQIEESVRPADGKDGVWTLPEREKLTYRVKWIGIPAGEIVSEIKGFAEVRGRKAYVLEVTARTVGICSALYRIEDHYVSYLDVERLHILRQEVHRREGGYRKDSVTDFDQEAHKAFFRSATDGSEKTFDIPPDVQDTITASYVLRLLPLQAAHTYKIPVINSEKNYDVFVAVSEKETLAVPGHGRREVFHITPFAKLGGEAVREGRMTGFVGVEAGHTPFSVAIKAPVFTAVTAVLAAEQAPLSNP